MCKAVLSEILSWDSMSWMKIPIGFQVNLIHVSMKYVVSGVYHKHLFISDANTEGHA
jgi:hypothetical protein